MIDTPRLWLVPMSESSLTELVANRPLKLGDISITVPPEWADLWIDHPGALEYTLKGLQDDPTLYDLGWWSYFVVYRAKQKLIGLVAFKGKPDATGTVEIGYSIIDPYRQQGLATEAARGLTQLALDHPDVQQVIAHTLAFENPSNRLLKSLGFHYNGLSTDPDEGEEWQWVLAKKNPD
jgi:RimJ/RimL family protein N-acetyltransferase